MNDIGFMIGGDALTTARRMRDVAGVAERFVVDGLDRDRGASGTAVDVAAAVGDWEDFDQLYLALQWLWLAPLRQHDSQMVGLEEQLARRGLFDGDFDDDGARFQVIRVELDSGLRLGRSAGSLLSEHAVLRLIQFRRIFEETVTYPVRVIQLDIRRQPMTIVFGTRIPNVDVVADALRVPPGSAGVTVVEQSLSNDRWLAERRDLDVKRQKVSVLLSGRGASSA